MPSDVTPKTRTYADTDLVVYEGRQFKVADLPEGVDAKDLPTLRKHLDGLRVVAGVTKQVPRAANKSASADED